MFKITKSETKDKYDVNCYFFNVECHSNTHLYQARNLAWEDVARFVKGRLMQDDDLEWSKLVLDYTKSPAYIGDDGTLRAVSVGL